MWKKRVVLFAVVVSMSQSVLESKPKKVARSTRSLAKAAKKNYIAQAASDSDNKKQSSPVVNDSQKDIYKGLGSYAETIGLVQAKGLREVDFNKYFEQSLKAAVADIDPHSAFFSEKSYKTALESTSGEFSGIGVSIIGKTPEDEALPIIDVIQEGPAFKAGLLSGDKIIEVDGEKLRGLSTDEVVAKLKGKVGSLLELKIIRDKKPMNVGVKRDIVKDQTSQCYLFEQQDVYYLSLKIFNEMSADQISKLLKKANEGKCRGIVLDLRRNPGGTLDAAIEMAELFYPKGL